MSKLLRKKIHATYSESVSKRLRKRPTRDMSLVVNNVDLKGSLKVFFFTDTKALKELRMRADRVKEVSLLTHVSK